MLNRMLYVPSPLLMFLPVPCCPGVAAPVGACRPPMGGKRPSPPHSLLSLHFQSFTAFAPSSPQVWQHPWVRAGPRWEAIGSSIYHVRTDPTTGAVYADAQLLQELEEAGYSRSKLLQV